LRRLGELQTASPLVCGDGAEPEQNVPREGKRCFHTSMLQLPVGEGAGSPSRQLSVLQTREGTTSEEEVSEINRNYNGNFNFKSPGVSFAAALRGSTEQEQRARGRRDPVAGPHAREMT
jgi:hypothetical protein